MRLEKGVARSVVEGGSTERKVSCPNSPNRTARKVKNIEATTRQTAQRLSEAGETAGKRTGFYLTRRPRPGECRFRISDSGRVPCERTDFDRYQRTTAPSTGAQSGTRETPTGQMAIHRAGSGRDCLAESRWLHELRFRSYCAIHPLR